jgi:hypothetical protein
MIGCTKSMPSSLRNGDCWVIAGAIFEVKKSPKTTENQYDA